MSQTTTVAQDDQATAGGGPYRGAPQHQRTMIRVEGLSKSYGPHQAVRSISFEVHTGEVLGFLGPNGAGKSTTMKILTCYIAPTGGTAYVAGNDVREDSLAVRRQLGYLPEDTPIYTDMTTLEFLRFAASLRGVDAGRRDRRIHELSEVCGLLEVLGKPIGALSKGYRQRVGLAQAMIHDPPILILDEPTSGLDPNQIVEIRELIKEIGREKTVILSTHILPEVQATCSRVIIIADGKLVADGAPDELTAREATNQYRLMIAADGVGVEEARARLSGIAGVGRIEATEGEEGAIAFAIEGEGSRDLRRDLFACARDSGWVLLELVRQSASLEDVFRKLTTRE